MVTRREFLQRAAALSAGGWWCAQAAEKARLNILLITADDLNWDSLGVTGCTTPDISPHIDQLASEGVRFAQAFVTTSLCGPARTTLMTGRYPHRNGAVGFADIFPDVPTLGEHLRAFGYYNGIIGKVNHITPEERCAWDYQAEVGKDPDQHYAYTAHFLEQAAASGRPFFLMANSHDPHRQFPPLTGDATTERYYAIDEVDVPPFLPDIPVVREEITRYYTAVRRGDQSVGETLRALDDAGHRDDTLVMFLSDNGMPFVFAKGNCYPQSTRTPWIVRWPGVVTPGTVDATHFISALDFMPTVLDAVGAPPVKGLDGFSFLPLLRGETQRRRDRVFTSFDQVNVNLTGPIRCVTDKDFTYIYNGFHGREAAFCNGVTEGRSFPAMQAAAESDPAIAARVQMHLYRVPDELYRLDTDPYALDNLVNDGAYQSVVKKLRKQLREQMEATEDPLLSKFQDFLKSQA